MAKLTLSGCKHSILKPWGDAYPGGEYVITHVTCMICYERLINDEEAIEKSRTLARVATKNDNSHLRRDRPALPCEHRNKTPIDKPPKYVHGDYTDALCDDCGVVLRHPEGPGRWEEVLHNGYVIREEP